MKPFLLALLVFSTSALAGPLPNADAVFPQHERDEIELGRLLFYDPVLSGNRNISCATCHHVRFGTSDGLSLGLGDGATGLGPDRRYDPSNLPEQRIPRNSPALFNLGATEFVSLFHDGRLEADPTRKSGIRTPLGADMEEGFRSILSAQTMFPVLSPDEMAGHYSENDVAKAVRLGILTGDGGAWDLISKRIEAIAEYRKAFDGVIGDRKIHFTDISNMIAAFIAFEWRTDDSPFDRHIRGESKLEEAALEGLELFYGKAGCDRCHSGQFQTDHKFHAIAMPQIGPGKAERFEDHVRDTGRLRVTGDLQDAYAFRTPSLRNVSLTSPYGHSGSYRSLEAVIRHHLDPVKALENYDRSQAILPELPVPSDFRLIEYSTEVQALIDANQLSAMSLTDNEVSGLIAFLEALTDETAIKGRLGVPTSVPSGLPVDQ